MASAAAAPSRSPSPQYSDIGGGGTSTFRVASRGESPLYRRAQTPPRSATLRSMSSSTSDVVTYDDFSTSQLTRSLSSVHLDSVHETAMSSSDSRSPTPITRDNHETTLCPICQRPILPCDDVVSLGCSTSSQRHQIHCRPCQTLWLHATDRTRGVQCPLCRSTRPQLDSMTPGGTFELDGGVAILSYPHEPPRNMDVDR